jgi:heme exporter protein A
MKLLSADNLQLWRGDRHVLRGVSFAVDAGDCLLVTGANGAGKTSLLRAVCGLLPLEGGTVSWRGQPVQADRYAFHRELAYLGHGGALKAELSARENLHFSAGLRRRLTAADIDQALNQVGLANIDRRLARQMSAGQQRRVALARVLLQQCRLWVLDEPTSNLDAQGQQLFSQLLMQHLKAGGIALVASHHMLPLPGVQQQQLELQ